MIGKRYRRQVGAPHAGVFAALIRPCRPDRAATPQGRALRRAASSNSSTDAVPSFRPQCEEAIPEYETALALNRNMAYALIGLGWCKVSAS